MIIFFWATVGKQNNPKIPYRYAAIIILHQSKTAVYPLFKDAASHIVTTYLLRNCDLDKYLRIAH